MQMPHAKNLNPERFELGATLSEPSWSIDCLTVESGLLNILCFTHRPNEVELTQLAQAQSDI